MKTTIPCDLCDGKGRYVVANTHIFGCAKCGGSILSSGRGYLEIDDPIEQKLNEISDLLHKIVPEK